MATSGRDERRKVEVSVTAFFLKSRSDGEKGWNFDGGRSNGSVRGSWPVVAWGVYGLWLGFRGWHGQPGHLDGFTPYPSFLLCVFFFFLDFECSSVLSESSFSVSPPPCDARLWGFFMEGRDLAFACRERNIGWLMMQGNGVVQGIG